MASSTIHLAVAKEYIKKNSLKNVEDFLSGTLYPDATQDKDKAHYTDLHRKKDILSHVRGKVNLFSFLNEHEILNDFELGWFLHLITDYLFFLECFSEEYLLNVSDDDFRRDAYFAYGCFNGYLSKKYHITMKDYQNYLQEYYSPIPYQDNIFSKKLIDDFIKRVSSIELDEYILKIKKNKGNIIP